MVSVLKEAHANRGASFVEVFQNCVVFNDGAHAGFTDKQTAPDNQLHLEHGKPLIFGRNRDRGLRLRPRLLDLEVVTIGADGVHEDDILVHDERNRGLAMLLAHMAPPEFPIALGVLYRDPQPSYESGVSEQSATAGAVPVSDANVGELLGGGRTWTVE
jgi:2-oxoglutarate ferredoxin oxidoreductase subunit beta